MERDPSQFGWRARAAQLIEYFFRPQQQQSGLGNVQDAQRQTFLGVPTGADNPDLRNRFQESAAAMGPDDDRPTALQDATQRQAEIVAQARAAEPPRFAVPLVSTAQTPPQLAQQEQALARQLAALQQAIQERQQAQQRGHGRGY